MLASQTEGLGPISRRGANGVQVAGEVCCEDADLAGLPLVDGRPTNADCRGNIREAHPCGEAQALEVLAHHRGSCSVSRYTLARAVRRYKPFCAAERYVAQMNAENDDLASSLRDVRVQRGMSVRDLAPLVGVSFTTLAAWERGAIDPPLSKLRTWARALGGIATIVWSDTSRDGRPVTMAKMELITTVFAALDDIEDSDAQFLARHIQTIAADRVAVPLAAEPPPPPYLLGPKKR